MKKLFPALFIFTVFFGYSARAQYTKQILKKTVISHFYTCSLDEMLDTLSMKYKLPIFFEREPIHAMDVNNRFFNESLQNVLKFVCRENALQYWVENDGTIYILQKPDDLPHLKKLKQFRKDMALIKPIILEAPSGPPKHFDFSIVGRVTDQNTGESLPGATVKVRNTNINTLTNISGNFTLLKVPSDTVALEVSFVGYQPDTFRLNSKNIDSALTLSLFPSMNALNEVDINGKKTGVLNTDSKRISVLQLAPSALDKLPNIGERDVMRAFQLMPGVSATNESSSGAYVRGGTPDQNLVMFDGFTVYQVDHLYGFFSAFNSNAVRDVELYKGGFSAKYGGRLSSVTVITGKDGNKNEANIGGDLSLLSTNIYAEMPIGSTSSLLVAARRSYQGPLYDKLFGQFNTSTANSSPPGGGGGRPGGGGRGGFANQVTPASNFYDLNAKYVYTPSKQNSFALSIYNGADNLNNSREMSIPAFSVANGGSDITINDYSRSGNTGGSLKWTSTINHRFFANTVISYSEFFSDRNRGTQGTSVDSGITKSFNNGMLEHNLLRDFSAKSDWELQVTPKAKLLYGGYGSLLHIQYSYTQNDTSKLISQDNRGTIAGGYAELELDPTNKLHVQPGVRETYFSPTGQVYAEPRLSTTYQLTGRFNLKAAVGRFYQFTNQVVREDIVGGDRNFWVLANKSNIPVSRAEHYIFGFNYETKDFLFDVEGYYKNLNGLTQYSIRQQGGTSGGGGPFSASTGTSSTITENFYNGVGYAEGIEFLLQKKAGSYTGWVSYTLGQAKSKFDAFGSDYFSSNQDITHEFKSINMYHLQRWSFSAVFIASTGHPYTAPLGSYTVNTLDGNKTTYLTISGKNGERLPAYHRLDMSATYDILKFDGAKTGSIGLSLFNVYNHVNTWYNEYYIQNNQVITTTVKYLGFTPNITLSLKWK
ncbi:outer membrane receptor for ferrienterochelin and colicin [Mucilaginibacter gracilis]|uniref:Outer membrane receptor for ferrienterochelin and colicin n=1 Tax=Mucilaginibacter gracilis TaxID=423350 RepID=A0A495JCE9_9SPHI|nr:TonB-dependent receptor [Mucilaginibacter gracilis]RKR85739.1 outer membrane receptor for ferrienterochelin and colicin [Mucilaginibacter gracilis]